MMNFLRIAARRGDWAFFGALLLLAASMVWVAAAGRRAPAAAAQRGIEIDRQWLRYNQRRENLELERQREAERGRR